MNKLKRPLVTVVIASYNHRNYVENAIKSIVMQEYPSLDLLVIDDGSTDGSDDLLVVLQEIYKFRFIRRTNGGLVSVINMGIREAHGDFVVFHASDDESLPDRFRVQVEILERFPNAAFVSGNVAYITEDGLNRGTSLKIVGREREFGFDDLFLHRASVSSVASMYRATALRQMGQICESYRAEDPQIFLRLTKLGYSWVQSAGAPVISYRMLFTSQSRTTMPLLLRQHARLVDEFKDHPLHAKAAAYIKICLLSSLAENSKLEVLKEIMVCKINYFSVDFLRVAVKLACPRKWHHFFKKSGKSK